MVTYLLRFLRQVVRIYTYAMTTYQAGLEWKKVPFRSTGRQYIVCVYTQQIEYFGQLIYKGNIDVALRVFNHFCGFSYFYAWRLMRAGSNYRPVQVIHPVGNGGGRT